jgi:hypothetical protein
MAATAFYLAAKVEESMRTVKHVALSLLSYQNNEEYSFDNPAPQKIENVSLSRLFSVVL